MVNNFYRCDGDINLHNTLNPGARRMVEHTVNVCQPRDSFNQRKVYTIQRVIVIFSCRSIKFVQKLTLITGAVYPSVATPDLHHRIRFVCDVDGRSSVAVGGWDSAFHSLKSLFALCPPTM